MTDTVRMMVLGWLLVSSMGQVLMMIANRQTGMRRVAVNAGLVMVEAVVPLCGLLWMGEGGGARPGR